MSERPPLPPGPWLVVGLARSGIAAARALREHGEVLGADSGRPNVGELRGLELALESEGLELLERAQTVVKSPGVPQEAPVIATARERGIPVLGELEIGWRLLGGSDFIAVTGTNGKTTTTELLGAIHREVGIAAAVAGNVGTPVTALTGEKADVVICEASSFQLEDSVAFAPEAALLLNLSDDHIDRHGTFEAYREAKLRAFANQRPQHLAVLPDGFGEVPGEARRVGFGGAGELTLREGRLHWQGELLMAAADVRLRGAHNLENAMAAAAAALARGLPRDAVAGALAGFAGVPHRLEEVAERDGVLYVNDSKATNVASALVGIEAFEPGSVHAILGGSLKGGGFEGLRAAVAARCRAAYLIGEAADRLAQDLDGTVPLERAGDLDNAVAAARRNARPGEVVLLSPACASYDQYADYEERGEHFRRLAGG